MPTQPRAIALLVCLLLPLAVLAIYWPGLSGGFTFDDFPNIVGNTALHVTTASPRDWLAAVFSSPSSDLQRPLAMATFAANHYFTGLDPWPMKLTNVAMHALNGLLVFALVRQVVAASREAASDAGRFKNLLPAFVAAMWAFHPINLMAVLLVVQRMEILCHTFVFIGLLFYVRGRQAQLRGQPGWTQILVGLVLFTVLGMLSKESAALLPLYAFVLELTISRFAGQTGKLDRRVVATFAAVLFLPAVVAVAWLLPKALEPEAYLFRNFSLVERLLTEPRVVIDYLCWTLLPDLNQLSLYHDDYLPSRGLFEPASTAASILAVLGILTCAWLVRRKRPLIAIGLIWFFCAHLLTGTFISLELVFEHRNYFASVGVCLALGDLLLGSRSDSRRRLGVLLAVVFISALSAITHLRAREWSDPVRFTFTEAAKHPNSPRASYDLARSLVILGNYDPKSPFTRQAVGALERARKLPGSGVLPVQGLLILAARSGLPLRDDWWEELRAKLVLRPLGPQEIGAIGSLGKCAAEHNCDFPPEQMLAIFGAALKNGQNPEILNIYGDYALNVLADPELSLRLWSEATLLSPGGAQFRINRARLLIALGRFQEAEREIHGLRELGRLGQHRSATNLLQQRLDAAISGKSAHARDNRVEEARH